MNVYVNELSFHGQFPTISSLMGGLKGLWAMHELCRRYGTPLYCMRNALAGRPAVPGFSVRDAVLRHAAPDDKRMVLTWIDKTGPFWDENRIHDANAYYYLLRAGQPEELVPDSGLAECTACCLAGDHGNMASVLPSDFEYTPILTEYEPDQAPRIGCQLRNFWRSQDIETALQCAIRLASWADLATHARATCAHLLFTAGAFDPLIRQPFSREIASRIVDLFRILDRLSASIRPDGSLSAEGQTIHGTYLTGHRALFTDSSDDEKIEFANGLTFAHPLTGERVLFPWHGKIRMGVQYRVHFEWPMRDSHRQLPVVYVGPKLTKR